MDAAQRDTTPAADSALQPRPRGGTIAVLTAGTIATCAIVVRPFEIRNVVGLAFAAGLLYWGGPAFWDTWIRRGLLQLILRLPWRKIARRTTITAILLLVAALLYHRAVDQCRERDDFIRQIDHRFRDLPAPYTFVKMCSPAWDNRLRLIWVTNEGRALRLQVPMLDAGDAASEAANAALIAEAHRLFPEASIYAAWGAGATSTETRAP